MRDDQVSAGAWIRGSEPAKPGRSGRRPNRRVSLIIQYQPAPELNPGASGASGQSGVRGASGASGASGGREVSKTSEAPQH